MKVIALPYVSEQNEPSLPYILEVSEDNLANELVAHFEQEFEGLSGDTHFSNQTGWGDYEVGNDSAECYIFITLTDL